MSSESVKNRSSSSCARRRSTNRPIWLPMLVSIDSRSSSGARISRLKNSITPRTSPRSRMGNPNAAWSPSRAAIGGAREIRVLDDVGNPRRLRRWPRRGPAGRCRGGTWMPWLDGVELREVALKRRSRSRRAAQDVRLPIDRPERAVLPAERACRWPRGSSARPRRTSTPRPAPGHHVLGRESSLGNPFPLRARPSRAVGTWRL